MVLFMVHPLYFRAQGQLHGTKDIMARMVAFPKTSTIAAARALALCLLLSSCLLVSCTLAPSPDAGETGKLAGSHDASEQLGIKVESLRWSADGYMLDFRYRVIDPEKARPVLTRSIKPYIIDEATGAKFLIPSSPKVGAMRQTTLEPEAGRTYWLLFANPAKYIKPGNLVTVVIGDHRLEHIVVE